MRILIDITHPAHVHFFRNAIDELATRGHQVAVTAKAKDLTLELLEDYRIPFSRVETPRPFQFAAPARMIGRDLTLGRFCRGFRPDVVTAIGGMNAAQTAFALRRPSVVWDDTDFHARGHMVTHPFATEIHSPDTYRNPHRKNQILYPGSHDLAYLHPRRFTPDPGVAASTGVATDTRYCIVRFVSWDAQHDRGQSGLGTRGRLEIIEAVSEVARPYITSEGPLPQELEEFRLRIPPHQVHHVMAYAELCISEGATMITEGAVLGVPGVYISTLRAGVLDMFERYGLIHQTSNAATAESLALSLLADENAGERAQEARDRLIADKIDVTDYIVETLERVGTDR
ncbi:MAG: DUF354 domain-containing protein [Acidimicrobiia bacterium]|nr:DUF354 domain-containing protein [Acidimicrobiia bacterium]NNC41121.1 DUF354 domain-containing protein [Acidimicrobiia bacterium]